MDKEKKNKNMNIKELNELKDKIDNLFKTTEKMTYEVWLPFLLGFPSLIAIFTVFYDYVLHLEIGFVYEKMIFFSIIVFIIGLPIVLRKFEKKYVKEC